MHQIKTAHPNDGEIMVAAHLKSREIHVPRARLRAAIHRLDPSTRDHMNSAISQRVYYTQSPNSVWHLDGNHRWRFGGIDGYSRLVVFLRCSANNKASTMLSCFQGGVEAYGLPNKIRSDLGGENVQVWRYMMEQHGNDASHVIVGSSTHNERIERLWRDVHCCVLKPFADKFQQLEQSGLLDTLNEIDMFCLHVCFLPRINHCLTSFQEAWNNHHLSTEGSATPQQLFLAGLLVAGQVPELPNPLTSSASSLPTSNDAVAVPRSCFLPCSASAAFKF